MGLECKLEFTYHAIYVLILLDSELDEYMSSSGGSAGIGASGRLNLKWFLAFMEHMGLGIHSCFI